MTSNPRILVNVVILFGSGLGITLGYQQFISQPRVQDSIEKAILGAEIVAIAVYPYPANNRTKSPVQKPLLIRDRKEIASISSLLLPMYPKSPNHPRVISSVAISLQLSDREIGGILEESTNVGTTFYVQSGINHGFVQGIYRVPDGSKLIQELSRYARQSPGNNTQTASQ